MAEVAVLVLNWNGAHWLEPCLESILAQAAQPFETWLVDNGSADGSIQLVEERFPSVGIVRLPRNLGFGAAYNLAIQDVRAPFIALLNNDTLVTAGWLGALEADLTSHPEAAAVGSKLLFLDNPRLVNHAGGQLTVLGAGFDVGFGTRDDPATDVAGLTGCATGAAVLLRRDAFVRAGGFDPDYFAYFDDADLCWRFWLSGSTVRYQPAARVLHAYGGSVRGSRLAPFRIEHCQTNRLQNMLKHLEPATFVRYFPASLAYDALRLSRFTHARAFGSARALVRGWKRFVYLVPRVLRQRRRIQHQRQRSDAELFDLGVLAGLRQAAIEWSRLENLRDRTCRQ